MFSSFIPLPFFIFLECYKIFRARKYARERCSVRNPPLMELNETVSMNSSFLFFVAVTVFIKICLVDELKFYKFKRLIDSKKISSQNKAFFILKKEILMKKEEKIKIKKSYFSSSKLDSPLVIKKAKNARLSQRTPDLCDNILYEVQGFELLPDEK